MFPLKRTRTLILSKLNRHNVRKKEYLYFFPKMDRKISENAAFNSACDFFVMMKAFFMRKDPSSWQRIFTDHCPILMLLAFSHLPLVKFVSFSLVLGSGPMRYHQKAYSVLYTITCQNSSLATSIYLEYAFSSSCPDWYISLHFLPHYWTF